jgi:hypothetical protein
MQHIWILAFYWCCTVLLVWVFWRPWSKAVRTGKWVKGRGRSINISSKHQAFTIYDRLNSPFIYWSGAIGVPVITVLLFVTSVLTTEGYFREALGSIGH